MVNQKDELANRVRDLADFLPEPGPRKQSWTGSCFSGRTGEIERHHLFQRPGTATFEELSADDRKEMGQNFTDLAGMIADRRTGDWMSKGHSSLNRRRLTSIVCEGLLR